MTNGTPKAIHSPKEILDVPCKYFSAIALGGVPIGVPIPPILAANGIHKAKAVRLGSFGLSSTITGAKIESIMAVVAVLDINIENIAVISIKPNIIFLGLSPKGFKNTLARFTSKRYLVAAIAKKKPPKNNIIIGLANVAMMSVWFKTSPYKAVDS